MLLYLQSVHYLARQLYRRVIGPEQTVYLCLKIYTAHRVALHSRRFYVTLACECLLLMVVQLHSQKLNFFVLILRMCTSYEAHRIQLGSSPNSTGKLAKLNWEGHQIQLLRCSPVVLAYITCMLFL